MDDDVGPAAGGMAGIDQRRVELLIARGGLFPKAVLHDVGRRTHAGAEEGFGSGAGAPSTTCNSVRSGDVRPPGLASSAQPEARIAP